MTALPKAARGVQLRFAGAAYDCVPGESVLQALLRQGAEIPYSCRKGVCFSCLLRCSGGDPGVNAQAGLKDVLRLQGYFLACQSVPETDLDIGPLTHDGLFTPAEVVSLQDFTPEVRQLRLRPLERFDYRPGQFINLRGPAGLVRSYSLASLPESGPELEVHVRRYDNGAMSGWIFDRLRPGGAGRDPGAERRLFLPAGRRGAAAAPRRHRDRAFAASRHRARRAIARP